MAKLKIRNDSGGVLYLEDFGQQSLANGAQITLESGRNDFINADQLSTLITSGDVVVIDDRGDDQSATHGERMRLGFPDAMVEERGSHRIIIYAKKNTAGTLSKGTPVYVAGYDSGTDTYLVEVADADTSNFPAIGIVNGETITNTACGHVCEAGRIEGIDTSSWSVGDALYVSASGTLTATKPTGIANKIQKVAQVLYIHATEGVIAVFGAGRANDLPNITSGKVWMGNGSDVPTETDVYTEAEADTLLSGKVDDTITLTAAAGLSGGGDLTTNRSFSVNVQNSIEINTDVLQLVGDAASPGNSKLYGTNGSGVKGWYDVPNSAVWGLITGTLSSQTDLQNALDGKSDTGHSHTLANITDSGDAAGRNTGMASGNVLKVGPGGLAINEVVVTNGAGNAETDSINTGFNLDLGTSAGTVAEGNHTHSGMGDVSGPGSSTDNTVARFDGTTGKIIQDTTAGIVSYDDIGSFTVDINSGQYALYLTNDSIGGPLLNCQNHLSNDLLQIRANGSGDAQLEVFTNAGNSPLLVDGGYVKIGNNTGGVNTSYDLYLNNAVLGISNALGDNIGIQAPAGAFTDYTLTLPTDDGTIGQVLITNGSGVLSWDDANNHNHAGVYEPVFTKNTAFNKDFGSGVGTVSEGNHDHSGVYSPIGHDHSGVYSPIGHSHSIEDMTDVASMTPSLNDVLSWNGSLWTNQPLAAGATSKVMSSWTLLSGTLYYNDFTHNLGTDQLTVYLYDTTTKQEVRAEYTEIINNNTVRVVVEGNTENLTCNVVTGYGPSGSVNSMSDLSDADTVTSPPSAGDHLEWDGTNWVPAAGGALGSIDVHSDVDTTTTPPSVGDHFEWDGSNWVPTELPTMVFGSGYEEASADSTTGTASATYVNKLTHTTAALAAGNYRIGYSWEATIDTNGIVGGFEVKIGAEVIAEPSMEADSDWHQFGGFVVRNLSGAQTLDINYKSGDGVSQTQMRRVRIEIWRVS